MRLLEATISGLERAGMAVFWQSQVPSNDGGLALGQAVVANAAFR
jgi:hydrogenase maturation factor HypF (carbamoyltransferase family)